MAVTAAVAAAAAAPDPVAQPDALAPGDDDNGV